MSDSPEGPGWWQASDGKWYPPEQQPGYQQPAAAAGGTPGQIDVGAAFQWTWAKFQQNIQPLLIIGAIVAGVPFLLALISFFTTSLTLDLAITALQMVIGFILPYFLTRAALRIANGETLDTSSLFQTDSTLPQYVLGAILFGIMSIIGCFVFCIGLIIVFLIFGLWSFVVVDRKVGAIEGITGSKDLTMGPGFGNTFVPMLLFLLLSFIGVGFGYGFFIGSLIVVITQPLAQLYGAYVYKSLSGQTVAA